MVVFGTPDMLAGGLARRPATESGECCYSTCKPAECLKAFVRKPLFPLGVNSVIGPNIEVLHPANFGVEQRFERMPKSLPDCPLQRPSPISGVAMAGCPFPLLCSPLDHGGD